MVGVALFGISLGLVIRAGLGLAPWDVFHQGLAAQLGVSIGAVIVGTSAVVLLAWIPLRERPGIGTLANGGLVGLWVNLTLDVIPESADILDQISSRVGLLAIGLVINGIGSGMYIGAGLGPGPRDGLMTAIARRGFTIRRVRTMLEASVLIIGVVIGGTIGVGTVVYALGIGPLAHVFIPIFQRIAQGPAIESPPDATPHGKTRRYGPTLRRDQTPRARRRGSP
jgi:uncharacterized membrane protein YczE